MSHTLNDPVRVGLVASFARPGGNLTGNAGLGPELDQKRVELLKDLIPSLSRAAVLVNPANPMTRQRLDALKIEIRVITAADAKGRDEVLQAMGRAKPAGLIVFEDPVFSLEGPRIIEFAAKHRVPVVYTQSGHAAQRGPHRVRAESARDVSTGRCLRGQDSQRCEARRPPRRTAYEVRVGHQREDGEGARADDSAIGVGAGRPDHPMIEFIGQGCARAVGASTAPSAV